MMSLTDYAIFSVHGKFCALPIGVIHNVMPEPAACIVPASSFGLVGLIEFEGQVLPLFDLHMMPSPQKGPAHRTALILQLESHLQRLIAVRVDDAPIMCSSAQLLPATSVPTHPEIKSLILKPVEYAGMLINILDPIALLNWTQQK